jgi:hypothetical protein
VTLVNLTPHPIRIYPPDTPGQIDAWGSHLPTLVLEPCGQVARIGMIELGTQNLGVDVPVEYVEYHHAVNLPAPIKATWFVVSLALAISKTYLKEGGRADLLVTYREVRNLDGTVIGCRGLARPV